jgi:SpoVK/Ycf46/Vps4 family AAA+-type ATPase
MVSIFLRLLEKNDGVIFLTTNRADTIDEAFRSRITVSFEYEKLNKEARRQIWKNLFSYSKIDHSQISVDKLSELDVNGRQIKNLIRTAQTLSISRSVPLTMDILETCVQYI